MMTSVSTTTTLRTCSMCGTDKTYIQNNSEKWYHYKDTKERICKNCYSKSRTKPIIDLTKVKPSEIRIDNNSLSTTTEWQTTPKPKIKKLTKDQRKIIKQSNSIPFIQKIGFSKFGSWFSQCNVCGGRYSLLELTIPNYKNLVVRICSICMKYLNKFIQTFNTGLENSNKINQLVNKRDFDEINYLRMYGISQQHTNLTRDKWFL